MTGIFPQMVVRPLSDISRRDFVHSAAAIVPAAALVRARGECKIPPGVAARLDEPSLRALAEALLPSALGADRVRRVTRDFQGWLEGYRPGAERDHGYGTGVIEQLPSDPRGAWGAQLAALDRAARDRFGTALVQLAVPRRRELVADAIADQRLERLPPPAAASHIAVALLAWFYGTPEATDLCYRARIGKTRCRPLAGAADRPVPLDGEA